MIEGSLEVKLPTIMDRWKGRGGKSLGREQKKKEDQRKLRCRKRARHCGAKRVSKSKCTKHTRVGSLLEVVMSKKCTLLWREARFQVKMCKAHRSRTIFGSCDVEKAHAVLVRNAFPSQTVQSTSCSALLEVEMSKKCTPLWREARFEVKSSKADRTENFWKLRC